MQTGLRKVWRRQLGREEGSRWRRQGVLSPVYPQCSLSRSECSILLVPLCSLHPPVWEHSFLSLSSFNLCFCVLDSCLQRSCVPFRGGYW